MGEAQEPFEDLPKSVMTPWLERRIERRIAQAVANCGMGITDDEMAEFVPRALWKTCEVPAGTVVFADLITVFHQGRSRSDARSALFFVCTAAKPLRPWFCKQYRDLRYARPEKLAEAVV